MKNDKYIFGKKALSWMLALSLAVQPAAGLVAPAINVEAAEIKPIDRIVPYENGPTTYLKLDGKTSCAFPLPEINGEPLGERDYQTYENSFVIEVLKDGEWVPIDSVLTRVKGDAAVEAAEDNAYAIVYWQDENWSGWGMNVKMSETTNFIRFQSVTYEDVYLDYKLQELGTITSMSFEDVNGEDSITVGAGQAIAVNFDYIRLNDGTNTVGAGVYGQENLTWYAIVDGVEKPLKDVFTWEDTYGWDNYPENGGYWFDPIKESVIFRAKLKDTDLYADYTVTVGEGTKGNEYNPAKPDTSGNIPASNINKSGYNLIWSDEFDGTGTNIDEATGLDLDKWSFQLGDGTIAADGLAGWGNSERQSYTRNADNIKVNEDFDNNGKGDGLLRITAKYEPNGYAYKEGTVTEKDKYYTSARIVTKGTEETGPLFNTTYGYVEARMSLPATQGAWPAFWMLPQSTDIYGEWPVSGEIDIMETCGVRRDSACATLHYGAPDHVYLGSGYEKLNSGMEYFHTYALDWEPGKITFLYDGEPIYTQTNWESKIPGASESLSFDAPFNQPYYILLNLAVDSGVFGGSANQAFFQDNINMYVDYVRVYHKEGGYDATNIRRTQNNGNDDWAALAAKGNQVADITTNSVVEAENGNVNALEADEKVDANKWYLAYGAGGSSSVSTVDKDGQTWAKVDVTAAGTESYATQLIGHYDAKPGYVYKISLDAYAEGEMVGKTVSFDSKEWEGWSTYGISSFTLEETPTSYSFLIDQQAEFENCRMEVNLGAVGTGTVYVGNVKVEVVDPETLGDDKPRSSKPLASGEILYNGTFDQGFNKVGYWTKTEGTEFRVPAYTTERLADTDVCVKDVAAGVTKYFESRAQVSGATPSIYQSGFSLAAGEYTLAFDLYSESATKVTAALYSVDKAEDGTETLGNKLIESETVSTSAIPKVLPFAWTFKAPRALKNAALVLSFGDNASVQLDNVSLKPGKSATVSGAESMDRNSATYKPITYLLNDSEVTPAVNSDANPFYYEKGEGTIKVSAPTREGYSFAGWSLNEKAKVVEDYVTEVSTNVDSITLYANWGERVTESNKGTVTDVTGVTVDKTATVEVGSKVQLTAEVTPSEATNQKVTWNSEHPEIAEVNANGEVTGESAGTTNITVTTEDGNFVATCVVTVTAKVTEGDSTIPVESVSIDGEGAIYLKVGEEQKLTATVLPENASNKTVLWDTDAPSTVSVKPDGTIKAEAVGTAWIIVKTEDGQKSDMRRVEVAAVANASAPQIDAGENVTVTVGGEMTPVEVSAESKDNGTLTYQWYSNTTASNEGGTQIEGAKDASYTPDALEVGTYYYYCVVTNTNEEVNGEKEASATSDVIVYNVIEEEIVNAATPIITENPADASYKAGTTASKLVVTASSPDGGALSYQWYKNTTATTTDGTEIDNATTREYTPSTKTVGTAYYYCVVTNTKDVNGTKTATAISELAMVKVTGEDVSAPIILTQPQSVNSVYGQVAGELKIQVLPVTDGTLSYQWYVSSAPAINGTAIAGATGASYVPSTGAAGTSYYYCVVTNTNANATGTKKATAVSSVVPVTVAKAAGTITVPATINKTYGNKAFYLNAVGQGALTYNTSSKSLATVDAAGKVKIKNTGKVTITITSSGDANHNATTAKVTINIAPKKVSGLKVKSNAKGKITVNWKKNTKATGYEIQYSTSSKFKSAKTVTITKNTAKKPSTTISKSLKAGKKYYVRIRAYKNKTKSKRVYSAWCAKKKVTVKK